MTDNGGNSVKKAVFRLFLTDPALHYMKTETFMYTTRTTLLEKIAAGDEIGWEDFYRTYRPLIRVIAVQYRVPEDDIDDIVQETMRGVFHNGNFAYRRESNARFRSWLGRIVRNKIGNYFEKVKRENAGRADLQMLGVPETFENDYLKEYRRHLAELALEELKQQVSPEIYETFALCRQGRSDKDVAALLDVKPNTVTVRKRRCVEILNAVISRLNAADPGLDLPPL